MGNCFKICGKSSSAVAAEEDIPKIEHEAAAMDGVSEAVLSSSRSVKIKMTKKEMKELFTKIEQQGIPAGEVLSELLEKRGDNVIDEDGDCNCGGGESEMRRQQSWRPMLQSISEIDQLK